MCDVFEEYEKKLSKISKSIIFCLNWKSPKNQLDVKYEKSQWHCQQINQMWFQFKSKITCLMDEVSKSLQSKIFKDELKKNSKLFLKKNYKIFNFQFR